MLLFMKTSYPLIFLALISVVSAGLGRHQEEPSSSVLKLGSRLELLVDDYLIDSMEGLELKLHSPRSAGKVLEFDRSWEGVTSGSDASVFQDGALFSLRFR